MYEDSEVHSYSRSGSLFEGTFPEVVKLIAASKQKASKRSIQRIDLHCKIGATLGRKIETAEWEMDSSNGWLSSLQERSQDCVNSLVGICSAFGTSTKPTEKTQMCDPSLFDLMLPDYCTRASLEEPI